MIIFILKIKGERIGSFKSRRLFDSPLGAVVFSSETVFERV